MNNLKMLTISSLLMISSLFGSNHTIKHKKMIDGLNLKNIDSVMFVAHPDDETIWGGSHLLKKHYLVVCLTNGNNKTRKKEFMNVMKATHNPDGEYGHIHHQMTSYIVRKDSRVDMNQLVYFGKYYRKKNMPKNLNSISSSDLKKKMKLTGMYSSQSKVMDHLGHMLPHENWVKAKDWR